MFDELLARFRALSLYYQEIHWTLKGSFFYQDHLLAERLYNETNDVIDEIAEKGIGATKSTMHVILPAHLTKVQEILAAYKHEVETNADFWNEVLRMEEELETFLDGAYKEEKNIGVENMLQGYLEDGLQRVYLVQRRTTT